MTPNEKAKELVNKFSQKAEVLKQDTDWDYDKECALILVEEIFKFVPILYWQEVKIEICAL